MELITAILLYLVAPFLTLFFWQVAADVRHWKTSPNTLLTRLRLLLESAFERAGRWVAWLSSYLTWLRFQVLWDAMVHLVEPLVGVLLSWYAFFKGYLMAAAQYTSSKYTIYLGTGIPTILILWVLYYYTPVLQCIYQGFCMLSEWVRPDINGVAATQEQIKQGANILIAGSFALLSFLFAIAMARWGRNSSKSAPKVFRRNNEKTLPTSGLNNTILSKEKEED